jgi:hypothetical protein
MQESLWFGWQEEEACPLGEARQREGDPLIPFKGFALGGDAASAGEVGPLPREMAFIVPEAVPLSFLRLYSRPTTTRTTISIPLTPHVGCAGSANPAQVTMAGARH